MNHNFLNIATDSGQKGDATRPLRKSTTSRRGQSGSSKEISRGASILHVDASFKNPKEMSEE